MGKHKKTIVGVMGSWNAAAEEEKNAEQVGALIASEGWVALSGGEPGGIMQAVSKGAKEAGGLVVGILPQTENEPYSEYIDVPIFTNASTGRDYYNVLSSDVVVICSKLSPGTLVEAVTALKEKKPIVVLNDKKEDQDFLKGRGEERVAIAETPEDAIRLCKKFLK